MGRVATAVDIIDHFLNLLMYNVHRKFTRLSVSIVLAKNFTRETGTVEKICFNSFLVASLTCFIVRQKQGRALPHYEL